MHSRTRIWLGAALIFAATFAAYAQALRCGWIWDDDSYITSNPTLTQESGLGRIWFEPRASPQYYPLVFTSYWIEHRLWGLNPAGYHATNVLLHALNALLWWRALRFLGAPGAFFAALIFALHPVHVESVAWVTERKNVLSGSFYLLSLLAWMRFSPPDEDLPAPQRRWGFYGLALLLFVAALLSKTVTCTLPAAISLGLWMQRGSLRAIGRRDAAALAPMFAIGIAMGLLTIHLERHHVGAQGMEWNLNFPERILIASRVVCFYAGKLLWPGELIFIYPRWTIDMASATQWLYPLLVVAALLAMWFGRRRIGRKPLGAALFFIGTLFPALGFFDVYPMRFSFVADHFQYLASMGVIALVTGAATRLAQREGTGKQLAMVVVCAVALLALAARTRAQTYLYSDEETLWTRTLSQNPQAWIAQNNLGAIRRRQNRLDEAMHLFGQVLAQRPHDPEANYNMGEVLAAQGRFDQAAAHFRTSLEGMPHFINAMMGLAVALDHTGHEQGAIRQYERILARNPRHPAANARLGVLLAERGDPAAAIARYQQALLADPDDVETQFNLGNAWQELGYANEAIAAYRAALHVEPNHAQTHANLAIALLSVGQAEQALGHLRHAVQLRPEDGVLQYNLGLALAQEGQYAEALAPLAAAVRLGVAPALTKAALAQVYAAMGNMDEAVRHGEQALNAARQAGNESLAARLREQIETWKAAEQ